MINTQQKQSTQAHDPHHAELLDANGEPDSLHIAAMDLARKQYNRIEELESALRHARVLCEWISETPHHYKIINDLSAQNRYKISKLLKD